MVTRLHGPVNKLATMAGPIAIGVAEDGTYIVTGPNDKTLLLRHGGVMQLVEVTEAGDNIFSYAKSE
jgi:hypothetical protein